ncbi:MAG: exodeoxyribonuclease V subunit beta [Azoarcus sp.]|jgi:exodeoxyribonuclease V beta subunit|nr:exodeoxyribonuclease V subunit beta [Azoarcus sp.]
MAAAAGLDVFTCPLDGIALIEASAGTGKTWNLCALYLRQLLEKNRAVSEVLVMTFTRAATAELVARIRARLAATLHACEGEAGYGEAEHGGPDAGCDGDPFVPRLLAAAHAAGVSEDDIRARLRGALVAFDEAAIFTIHGFCTRALADAPFAAALPFETEVGADDGDTLLETARDFWRREVAGVDAALADCLLASGDSPEKWAGWLAEALARPLAREMWDADGAGGDIVALDAALVTAYEAARAAWGDGAALLDTIRGALGTLNGNSYKPALITVAHGQWADWLRAGSARAVLPGSKESRLVLFTAENLAGKTNKGHTPPAHPFFAAAQILLDARARSDDALAGARLALLHRFIAAAVPGSRQRKREERRISFNDVLWNAHAALASRPGLAALLHERYPAALIDEFQDTDPLQWAIIARLYASGGRCGDLCLVGDPKQAIYSFRGADLHTYLAARGQAGARYTLDANRRSTPALVAACNQLFGANDAAFMEEGITFQPVRAVESASASGMVEGMAERMAEGAALRLWRLPAGEDDGKGGGERLPRLLARQRAAAASAAEIVRLIAAGVASREIAVLVRTHREGALMKAALASLGVASIEMSQASVYDALEAADLESVLRAVAEPARERLVKTALATALMGRTAAWLEWLMRDDDGLVREFERFARWHELWLKQGFAAMLWRWMAEENVPARLLARPDGERRLTNLFHLAELLQREAGGAAPAVLLRFLARCRTGRKSGGDDALLRLESDRDLVRIVTVHGAKGLEYEIVFCPFLFDGRASRGARSGPLRLWHDAQGRQVADWRRKPPEDEAAGIEHSLARERDAEALRAIYVALTRAKRRCYLVVGSYEKAFARSANCKESVHSLLNWLAAGKSIAADAWAGADLTPDDIDARWRDLAANSGGAISCDDLPAAVDEALAAGPVPPHYVAPAAPRVPSAWWMGSFSGLVCGATHEDAARDHDARIEPGRAPGGEEGEEDEGDEEGGGRSAAEPLPEDDILRFPRGAAAGDCIHAVFESIDFTRPEARPPAIARALAAHPLPGGDAALRARMLARLLDDVLATPLLADDPSLRLQTVPMTRRISELGFYLPVPRLAAGAPNDWLAARGYAMPKLAARELSGYLKGYIDLVFEHAGRFWVLDWKSNHLGESCADYGPDGLAAAMREHGYHLQYLLYTVALHRHLGQTLPGYDFARHFGGVLYLFVRGVRPGWRNRDGAPAGVFRHRPSFEDIAALEALLVGGAR